jgi:DNA-binding NarL/FixJ family response regulator
MRVAILAPALALRAGLHALLSAAAETNRSFEVVYEGASLDEFASDAPDVDVVLIAAEAVEATTLQRSLRQTEGQLAALILSDAPQELAQTLVTLPLRGWGVLPFDVSAEELQAGMRAVYEGLCVGAPALFAMLQKAAARPLAANSDEYPMIEPLTERESQVLQLLARGLANKQIGLTLGISEHTVKFHLSSIYTKLGTTNRAETVRAGMQRGLIAL